MSDAELSAWLMKKIQEEAELIRALEDRASKLSLDLFDDRAYIAIVAYKQALADVLQKLRGVDESSIKGRGEFSGL